MNLRTRKSGWRNDSGTLKLQHKSMPLNDSHKLITRWIKAFDAHYNDSKAEYARYFTRFFPMFSFRQILVKIVRTSNKLSLTKSTGIGSRTSVQRVKFKC